MGQTLDGVKFLGNGLQFVSCRKWNLEKLVIIFFFKFSLFCLPFLGSKQKLEEKTEFE